MIKQTFSESQNTQRKFTERRRKKDWVVYMVTIIAVLGWACAFVALLYVDLAKPERENFFTRLFHAQIRDHWDASPLIVSFRALWVSFVTCVVGFFVNMKRHRRKTDRYNKAILILGIISLIAIILFMINFKAILIHS